MSLDKVREPRSVRQIYILNFFFVCTSQKKLYTMSLTAISPVRFFFRASQNIPSIAHARAIAKEFNRFGDLLEYKFIRVCIATPLHHSAYVSTNSHSSLPVPRDTRLSQLWICHFQRQRTYPQSDIGNWRIFENGCTLRTSY